MNIFVVQKLIYFELPLYNRCFDRKLNLKYIGGYLLSCHVCHVTQHIFFIDTAIVEIYFVREIIMDAQDKEIIVGEAAASSPIKIKIKTKKIKTAEEGGAAKKRNRKGTCVIFLE